MFVNNLCKNVILIYLRTNLYSLSDSGLNLKYVLVEINYLAKKYLKSIDYLQFLNCSDDSVLAKRHVIKQLFIFLQHLK